MQPNPLFSVLIANYNNGIYLGEALQSVFAQTYTNWEIIIVDDGSTDNSKEIYKNYSNDSRIHIYYNEKNYGCGYTKRRCAELANGEICGFLDPDDTIDSDTLAPIVEEHLKRQFTSLIYTDFLYCDQNMSILSIKSPQCALPKGTSYLEYGKGAISQFATFKKALYDKTSGINSTLLRAVDQDLYLKLEEVGETYFFPHKKYYYRTNTSNNISLGQNSLKASLWHIITLVDACKRRNINIEETVFKYYKYFYDCYSTNIEKKYQQDLNNLYNTFSFKLGKIITFPFRLFQKILKKCTHKEKLA